MNPDYTPLSEEEHDQLPFNFTDGHWQPALTHDGYTLFATWNKQLLWAHDISGPWRFDTGDDLVTDAHWETLYPHYTKVQITTNNNTALEGVYNDKRIRWSRSNHRWQYLNHQPVNFKTESSSSSEEERDPDISAVDALLQTATESVTRTLTAVTPEQPKPPLPGTLLETPPRAQIQTQPNPVTPRKVKPLPTHPPAPSTSSQLPAPQFIVPPAPSTHTSQTAPAPSTQKQMATSTKSLGSPPEPFDGSSHMADAFWTNLATYYYLNNALYSSESLKIASALSHFKLGTPAGEWARDRQQLAMKRSPPDFGTWADFQKAYKDHFIPVETELSSTQKMHNLKMNNRPFTDWYQDWIVHANRSGANDATKMYAFRQNLPSALHNKIMAVHPAPTTLARLVELSKEFDQIWRMYNQPGLTNRRRPNTRTTELESSDPSTINATNYSPHSQKMKRLTQEEKDRRRRENLCSYCGKPGHWHADCRTKPQNRNRGGRGGPPRNNTPRTRSTQVDDTPPTETPIPDSPPTVSRLYSIPEHHFDLSHPDPDVDNQDF
jgi:hypothetical protein